MTKVASILAVLRDGPATTGEVAIETGLRPRLAGTHLRNLYQRGKLLREPFQKTGPGPHKVWLWRIAA